MENKRGDISLNFLAGLIVSIVGFAILLFVYFQLISGGAIDRQVCHTSVIIRATIPLGEKFVPLKCPTEKICITGKTFGKGSCEEFENEKAVVTMRVGDNRDSLTKIEKIYAQEVLSCWKAMGEGKVSYSSQAVAKNFGVGSVYSSCVICSRIAIDEESFDNVDFGNMDVYSYMRQRVVPDSEDTYLEQITNKNPNNIGVSLDAFEDFKVTDSKGGEIIIKDDKGVKIKIEPIELEEEIKDDNENFPDETAVLVMQITAPEHGTSLKNAVGATAVGTTVVSRGKIWALASKHPLVTAVTGVVLLGYQQGSVTYNRAVTASHCDDISIGSEARSGCTVVRTTNYEVSDILQYCDVIESIP
jgi:hypothetical protein